MRAFERRFTVEAMARSYLDIYQNLPGRRMRPISNRQPARAHPLTLGQAGGPRLPDPLRVDAPVRKTERDDLITRRHIVPKQTNTASGMRMQ